jgi:hypothetical protein
VTARADGFNCPGQIDAQNAMLGSKPGEQSNQKRTAAEHPVAEAHARRVDADEHLVVAGRRCRDLADCSPPREAHSES